MEGNSEDSRGGSEEEVTLRFAGSRPGRFYDEHAETGS